MTFIAIPAAVVFFIVVTYAALSVKRRDRVEHPRQRVRDIQPASTYRSANV